MAPSPSLHGSPAAKTPAKTSRPRHTEASRIFENCDPNLPARSPAQKPGFSPSTKSAKAKKSAPKATSLVVSPPPVVRERKFIVAKKRTKKGGNDGDTKDRRQAAYEALRESQESFFRKDRAEAEPAASTTEDEGNGEEKTKVSEKPEAEGSSKVRKIRTLMMEEAMNSMPEPGSGRVMHLVKAFESLLSIPKGGEGDREEESKKKVANWALPGLQLPPKAVARNESSAAVSSSVEFLFPPKNSDLDSSVFSSFDSKGGRSSFGSEGSGAGRRCRRHSSESLRSSWNKKLKVTRQHPFKLRTEQRGRLKEEVFLTKVKEMLTEEEKKRIPIAQGLPWTTEEPECLVKPPVKESTEPIDVVLHSDVRASERAAFDHYVTERMTLAEQLKLERERQEKFEEEEEIKRLRKELIPKAQPMPYFDRPFIPKRSTRPKTIPKDPRFHVRHSRTCETSDSFYGDYEDSTNLIS